MSERTEDAHDHPNTAIKANVCELALSTTSHLSNVSPLEDQAGVVAVGKAAGGNVPNLVEEAMRVPRPFPAVHAHGELEDEQPQAGVAGSLASGKPTYMPWVGKDPTSCLHPNDEPNSRRASLSAPGQGPPKLR